MTDASDLENVFRKSLKDPVFREVLSLVKMNSRGKIWVIGGFVYRNIVAGLKNLPTYNYDIDFLVEKKNKNLKKVTGWQIKKNRYDNPNYINDGHVMSFTTLRKFKRASGTKINAIDDYFQETPLNIQAVVYDLEGDRLLGEKGIQAILDKIITVNNIGEAESYSKLKQKSLGQIIKDKAQELGFKAVAS